MKKATGSRKRKCAGNLRLRRSSAGFSLVEVLLGMTIFSVSALTVMNTMVYSSRLDAVNKETAAATRAARSALEMMRGTEFSEIYATFNDNAKDDPGGEGTSPGNLIDVSGLTEVVGGPGSITGEVLFPVGESGTLNEKADMPELGLPRDLNGDGTLVPNLPVAEAFALPVIIRINWEGSAGERQVLLHTVLRP